MAILYGVTTANLNKAVKRNQQRFPPDFMFQLSDEETAALIFQSGRAKQRGGRRHNPYAFTEQGVAMLSSVLQSERAVQVNVAIMRAFASLRRMLAGNEALARKLGELERRLEGHDRAIKSLFDAIRELAAPSAKPRREIRFRIKEDSVPYLVCISGETQRPLDPHCSRRQILLKRFQAQGPNTQEEFQIQLHSCGWN